MIKLPSECALPGKKSATENSRHLTLAQWQYDLLDDLDSDIIAVTAGYGTGKSFASALWVLDRLAYNPGCDALFIEPTHRLISQVALPAFKEAFERLGILPNMYSINQATENTRIKLYTGQTIYFMPAIPDAIVGITTIAVAAIDEAGFVEEEVFHKLLSRLRYRRANKCQLLCVGTPEGDNWFSETFDSDTQPGWTYRNEFDATITRNIETGKTAVKRKYRRLRATIWDNEHNLAPSYIPNIIDTWGHNKAKIDSYLYGFFRSFATGMAYSHFKASLHIIPKTNADTMLPIYLSFDYNVAPAWVAIQRKTVVTNYITGKRELHNIVLDEASGKHDNLDGAVLEFSVKFPVQFFRNTPIFVSGDSSGRAKSHKVVGSDYDNILGYLHRLGYKKVTLIAIKSNPRETASVDYVQSALVENKLYFCENCTNTLNSIRKTRWSDSKRERLHKPPDDTITHYMDAVKYYFCAIFDMTRHTIKGGRM